ncbi:hypothetical protein HS125_10845 [bacterium]|nr:hypothetical protein [bacterium]
MVVRAEPVEVDNRTQYRVTLFFSRISPEDKGRLRAAWTAAAVHEGMSRRRAPPLRGRPRC